MQTATGNSFERTLTEFDFARLRKLASDKPTEGLTQLLDCVVTLDAREMPSNTVTMYPTVDCQDLYTGRRQQRTICYPNGAKPAAGLVSVPSPGDCPLLGLREGDVARWQTPSGEDGGAQVLSVLIQPEASDDYTL